MSSLSGLPPPGEKVEGNVPEDEYGKRLRSITIEDDVAALEEYLAPFHHRRVMPCTWGNPNPWETAIYHGKSETFRVLMKYVDYQYKYDGREAEEWKVPDAYPDRRHLFNKACYSCHVDNVHFLLDRFGPVVVRPRAPDGHTPILARYFSEEGGGGGTLTATTLSYAAELAPRSVIERLLKHGADINAHVAYEAIGGGVGNSTLLHIAARNLNADVVQSLLERPEGRAMASARDAEARTPLHCLATRRSLHERASRAHYPFQDRAQLGRRAVEIAEALLPYSDLEARGGPEGKTPLFLVAEFHDGSHEEEEGAAELGRGHRALPGPRRRPDDDGQGWEHAAAELDLAAAL
ncbi:uncharacterized protein PG986_006507 [Apiospora aurea]|uniref:Ankyrin repeat protein n=1 Tax=Apiospora aurea TaxID=335848 RepID=A0ABR1QKM3_9PEZI